MSLNFQDTVPGAAILDGLSQVAVVRYVNETVWIFAIVETAHLLFLAVLGGAVFALNLRLMGVALQSVPARTVERYTRPWLYLGIAGAVVTGLAMGVSEIKTLLPNAAFFVKMVALIAAILFSVAVSRSVRRDEDDQPVASPRLMAAAALALWTLSLVLFATTANLGPGALLVALAGFGLSVVLSRRHRKGYVAGLVVILGGGLAAVQLLPSGDAPVSPWLNVAPLAAALAFAGVVGRLESRSATAPSLPPAKLAAFASTLAWVTVAAAGRWIGFS